MVAVLKPNSPPGRYKVPSTRLGNKAKLAAQLFSLGYTLTEISKMLSIETARLAVISKSHLFRLEVDRARDRFIKAHADLVIEKIHAHAPEAVDKVVTLMKGAEDERVQLQAANSLVDRVVPKKVEAGSHGVTIVIAPEEHQYIDTVLAEYHELHPESPGIDSGGDEGEAGGDADLGPVD